MYGLNWGYCQVWKISFFTSTQPGTDTTDNPIDNEQTNYSRYLSFCPINFCTQAPVLISAIF